MTQFPYEPGDACDLCGRVHANLADDEACADEAADRLEAEDDDGTPPAVLLGGELKARRQALESEKRALEARLRELDDLDQRIAEALLRRQR